jgi:hypothetical protein
MLRNLFNAANVDVSADVCLSVYLVCQECASIGHVLTYTHPFIKRLQAHPALPLAEQAFVAEAVAHPVYCLASRIIVQRWEVMFHCRAPSQAHARQWHVFGIKISQKQKFRLLSRSAFLQALVQRILCFQGTSRVRFRYPKHLAECIMSQRHFVGLKNLFQEGQRLYGQQRFSDAANSWGHAALLQHAASHAFLSDMLLGGRPGKSWGHAALMQHAASHAFLSDMLLGGRPGVRKDEALAFEVASAGAVLHCTHSKGVLGRCLIYGVGVLNLAKGLVLARESEAAGSCFGQFAVGKCYEKGWGVVKDIAKAVGLWYLAAAQGHVTAQFNLGVLFNNGRDVEYDPIEAVRLFKLAAAQGHANARDNLGDLFFSGFRDARQ